MGSLHEHQNQTQNGCPKQAQIVVVMVPLPAQGHLNQLLQLSRLILSYKIPVHYVGAATHNRQAKLRAHGWDPQAAYNIHFHDFQIPPFLCPPPNPNAPNKFPSHLQPAFEASTHLVEPVTGLLRTLSSRSRKVIVIHDSVMGHVVQEVASLPNAQSYSFHSVSAFTSFLYMWDKMGKSVHLISSDFPDIPSLKDCFTPEFLDFIAMQYQFLKFNSGSIYNTCRLIEAKYMDLLKQETISGGNKKTWALGPFNPVKLPNNKPSNQRHFCLDWLDKQEPNSVIYVSFGTTTVMSDDQIRELAIGLKQSNQKFIWVLREADKGDVFTEDQLRKVKLPKGYEDSVRERGLVVRDWAPQLEILAHSATGGFLSHCGWNSCMESITMGVPIGAWPMHSDQPRNTVLITQVLKVGIVIKDWARRAEIVSASVVESGVKRLMGSTDGEEVRKRAAEMGVAVRRSVGEGGASRMELDSFIAHITS